MTEKEKMVTGKLYNASDKELEIERFHAKNSCHKYNSLLPSNREEQKAILKELLGHMKENIIIEQPCICDYGYNIEVGENFYANHGLTILDPAKVTFGDNVFIGPNCGFYTAGHPINAKERNKGLEYAKAIEVGSDVWIGGGVTVLPGIKIGSNVVIGAGSVVTKDVKSNCVIAGNPAKIIREIDK